MNDAASEALGVARSRVLSAGNIEGVDLGDDGSPAAVLGVLLDLAAGDGVVVAIQRRPNPPHALLTLCPLGQEIAA
jgi:hypothetical protein